MPATLLSDEDVGLGAASAPLTDSDVGLDASQPQPLDVTPPQLAPRDSLERASRNYQAAGPQEKGQGPNLGFVSRPLVEVIPKAAQETIGSILSAPAAWARERLEMSPDSQPDPGYLKALAQSAPSDKAIAVATGVLHAGADLGNFFTSPLGIGTLGLGALPAAAQRAIALAFAVQMAKDVPTMATELGSELGKPEKERDYAKIAELVTSAVATTGFAAAGGKHGLTPERFSTPVAQEAMLGEPAPLKDQNVPVTFGPWGPQEKGMVSTSQNVLEPHLPPTVLLRGSQAADRRVNPDVPIEPGPQSVEDPGFPKLPTPEQQTLAPQIAELQRKIVTARTPQEASAFMDQLVKLRLQYEGEKGSPNATAYVGQQQENSGSKFPRATPRAAIPENQVEIRGQEGQAANDSGSVVQGPRQAGPVEAQPGVVEVPPVPPPAPPEPVVAPTVKESLTTDPTVAPEVPPIPPKTVELPVSEVPPTLPPAQAAAVEAAKPAIEGAPAGAEVSGFRKNANGRWYRIEGGLKNVPANKKQSAQLEEAHAAGPIPVDERTPEQILGKARQVKVTVPEGATQIRVTQQNGQRSTEHIGSVNASVNKSGKGGNPFIGVDISKIEAGIIGKDNKFKAVAGEIKVEDVSRVKRAALGQREVSSGLTVDVGGQSMTLVPPESVDIGRPRKLLPAYHATPHEVDRFSTEKIGTGEGAQVYGWGLYFGEALAVGKKYLEKLGRGAGNLYTVDITAKPEELLDLNKFLSEQSQGIQRKLKSAGYTLRNYQTGRQFYESLVKKFEFQGKAKVEWSEIENAIDNSNHTPSSVLDEYISFQDERGGNMGTAEALYEFSAHERDFVIKEIARFSPELADRLSSVKDRFNAKKEASLHLQEIGIPGSRYFDQFSRHGVTENKTYNFVIWDESKIKITHKNGKAVTPEEFRRASLQQTQDTRSQIPQGEPIRINTVEDLRRVLNDPKSDISAEHRRVLQGMDALRLFDKYPGLRLEVTDFIAGGAAGEHIQGTERTGFARFLRSSESATPLHEFLHHIEGFLDAGDRAVIRELRLQKLAEQPPQLRDTLTPGMTSDEFVRAGLSRDVYHLSSDSEFFAWLMSERGLKAIDTPRATTFVGKVRELIQGLYKAIKNSLGLTAPEEALWQKIISRKNSYSPQEGIEFTKSERKLALPRTPEQRAQEKEFRKGPREMVDVGIAGAYGDPVRLIMGEADRLNLSPDARRLLGIPKMAEMFALGIGEQNSVFNYATAREWAKGKTPNEQWWVQQDALHSQGNVERNWQRIDTGFERAKAEVTSPAFQKRMAKLDQRELQMDNRAAQEKTWKNIIAVKVSEYTIALEKAKGDDAATQQLRSDLKQARDLLSRTQDIAIGMDQIVSKVWRNYWELGTDSKNGKTFFDLYESVRRGEGNPLVNPEERRLAQLSSEILAINRSLTTQLMWRERMRVEPDFAALVDNVGKAFAKRIQEDPAKAIQELVAKQGDKSVKADQARQAYLSLQKDVLAKIRNYSTFEEAKMAKDRVEQSEEWKQLVNQVNADAEALHIPYAQREQIRKGIFNEFRGLAVWLDPAGKVHTIDFGHDQADALKANEQLQGYLKSIQDWLFNPANENHPDQAYWQRQHDFVDAAYNTSGIFNPTAVQSGGFKFLRKSWGMPEFLFRQTKLAFMKITQLAVENWHRAYVISSQWAQAHQARIIRATFDSAKSHGVHLLGGGMAKHRIDVLNPLAWDYRHNVARRAGDVVNGVKLTSQDIAWLKMVGAAENELRRANKNLGAQGIMPQELLIDEWWAGTFAVRRSKEFGAEPGTTVSRVNAPRMKSLTEDFSKLDPADYDRQSDLLNQSMYRPWVRNWLRERSGDYSRISPFEALFKDLVAATDAGTADAIKPNANIIDEITDFINRNTDDTYDREGIRKGLLDDMGRELRQFYDQVYKPAPNEEATTVRIVRAGKDSSFTKGFAEDLSNSFAYDYGLTNTQEIRRVALASTDYHLQRMARAFGDAIDRYEGALRDLRRVKDDPEQLAAVRAKNRDLFQSGDDFRDFEDMEMHLSELKHFRDQLGIWSGDQGVHYEGLQTANRVINALAGLAISGPQTLSRIFVDSIFKAGMTLQSFERFQLLTYPKAIVSTVMSAFNIAVAGPVKFAARRVGLAKPLEKPMTDWIEEIYRNGKFMDQQYDYGLGAKFATWDHIVNNWTMPLTKGFGYNAKLSGNRLVALGQRGLARLLTAAETPLDIVKPVFPALGYAIHYDSVARLITWEMKGLEARARRTFDTYESLGQLGRFDFANPKSPQNALLPREIIPDGIMPTTIRQLSLVNEYFARGTDIRLNDQIIKFWAKLAATPKEERSGIHLLSAEAATPEAAALLDQQRLGALASTGLLDIHHAGPINRPWGMRQNPIARMLYPFSGWPLQSTRQIFALLGKSFGDPVVGSKMTRVTGVALFLATAGASVLIGDAGARMVAYVKWLLFNETDPQKHLSEGVDAKENARIAASDAINYISALNGLTDQLFGVKSGRTSLIDNIFPLQVAKTFMNYIGGVVHTGDPTYGLPALVKREVPLARILMNRLPEESGLVARNNVRTVIQKYAPAELVRDASGGFGMAVPNELSAAKNKLIAAVYNGSSMDVQEAANEFLAKATEIGRPNPDGLLKQVFRSFDPYSLALKSHPTDAQRAEILSHLSDREKKILLDGETNYLAAAQMLGFNADLVKADKGTGSGGGSASAGGSSAASESGSGAASILSGAGGGTGRLRALGSPGSGSGMGRISSGLGGSRSRGGLRRSTRRSSLLGRSRGRGRLVKGRLRVRSGRVGRLGLPRRRRLGGIHA